MPRRRVPAREIGRSILSMMASPNIASNRWVYQQYDHEVGLRTVIKPGQHDAALMRLPNGRFLAVKGDGNSQHSALDPYNGGAGCVAEACRNVVCVGGEPVAMVDHLQFGDPSDPEVYWSLRQTVQGMADYCRVLGLPVVGGKVSLYNEDTVSGRAIKPSPIALVVGLVKDSRHLVPMGFASEGDSVIVAGTTRPELGGSEYHRLIGSPSLGDVPKVQPESDRRLYSALLRALRSGPVTSVHDCSRGGLAVTLAEMCVNGGIGAEVDLRKFPSSCRLNSDLVFSESHGRFVLATADPKKVSRTLRESRVAHGVVGKVGGSSLVFRSGNKSVSGLEVEALRKSWEGTIPRLME